MNFNKSLINKTNNILKKSEEFDKIFNEIINTDKHDIDKIYNLTNLYITIRSEHGGLLLLQDKLKNKILSESTDMNDELINKLYDYSTFDSIKTSISNLVSNIDYEYKQIAVKYPSFVNKKSLTLLLFVNKIENNKYVDMFEELKNKHPENVYKVVETENNRLVNCKSIINKDIKLKIDKTPTLYMINGDIITEISLKENPDLEHLLKLID